jgi:4-hydroxybenzoate polyprenyltransferase
MDPRLLDLVIGVVALLVLIVMVVGLPFVLPSGPAYLLAIVIFFLLMTGAGYVINQRIR